jgi:hypothetical protein
MKRGLKKTPSTFDVFAKVNDRHFKVIRQKARIAPEPDGKAYSREQEDTHKGDIYFTEGINQLEENDEITSNEAAFMRGFLSA